MAKAEEIPFDGTVCEADLDSDWLQTQGELRADGAAGNLNTLWLWGQSHKRLAPLGLSCQTQNVKLSPVSVL
jgi:hypothetical protein